MQLIDYPAALAAISRQTPAIGDALARAHQNRVDLAVRLSDGMRVRGLNEVFDYLLAAVKAYEADGTLAPVAFLVARTKGKLEIALEATLSGMPDVVCDSMRDLMEMELLLDDFRQTPAGITDWLTLDRKARMKKFSPQKVRDRYAARVGTDPKDLGLASCYSIHSELLHVTPFRQPLGGPGVVAAPHPFDIDLCFGEIFDHARRTVYAIFRLFEAIGSDKEKVKHPETGLPAARAAWISTQAMLGFIAAMHSEVSRQQGAAVESDYDVDRLSIPARYGLFMFGKALELLDKKEVVSDSGEPIPKGELLAAAIPMVVRDAEGMVQRWLS